MKIHIIGFRCYTDSKFELCDNDLSLLKGASGIGKSTLLQAISWCLFGKIIRGVDPKSEPNGKLSVTIQHNGTTIYRQKRPNIVRVTKSDGKTYDSDIAESMIAAIYGSAILWPIVGYIQQGEINRLLSSSNADRTELLNKLTFDGCPANELPEVQIEKIDRILATTSNDFSVSQAVLTRDIELFTNHLHQTNMANGIDITKVLSDSVLNNKRLLLTQLKLEYENLIKKRAQHEHATSNLRALQERLSTAEKRLISSGAATNIESQIDNNAVEIRHHENQLRQIVDTRSTLSGDLSKLSSQLGLFKHRDSLLIQITQLENQNKSLIEPYPNKTFTQTELHEALNREALFSKYNTICQAFNLPYSNTVITAELLRIKSVIEQQPKLQKYHELKNLIMQIEARIAKILTEVPQCEATLDEITSKISEISNNIQQIEISRKALRCPHCDKCVKYSVSGKLEIMAGDYTATATDTSNYQLQLAKYNTMRDNITRSETLNKEIVRLNEEFKVINNQYLPLATEPSVVNGDKLLTSYEVSALYQRKEMLSSVQLSPMVTLPEISSKIITLIQARQLLQDKLTTLDKIISGPTPDEAGMVERQKQLAALDIKHSTTSGIINDLHNKMAALRNIKQQCLLDQALVKQITDEIAISSKLITPDIELLLTTNTKQQVEINCQIELSSKISHIINERNILQDKQDKLIKLGQRRTDLLKMKELAIQCECQQLSVTVDSLNNAIGAIAVYLFDSPITIKINLFKTFKTTQRIKPTVNVTVNYKGNDYDSLNGLSGGERDRISLCVTLAMNRISGCPLLFLDEVIGTLDAGLTETAIKSIKVSTVGKTCLLVSHSAVEGVFRDVIQFT